MSSTTSGFLKTISSLFSPPVNNDSKPNNNELTGQMGGVPSSRQRKSNLSKFKVRTLKLVKHTPTAMRRSPVKHSSRMVHRHLPVIDEDDDFIDLMNKMSVKEHVMDISPKKINKSKSKARTGKSKSRSTKSKSKTQRKSQSKKEYTMDDLLSSFSKVKITKPVKPPKAEKIAVEPSRRSERSRRSVDRFRPGHK